MIPQWSYHQTADQSRSGHLLVLFFVLNSIKITFTCVQTWSWGFRIFNHVEWTNKQKMGPWSIGLTGFVSWSHKHTQNCTHSQESWFFSCLSCYYDKLRTSLLLVDCFSLHCLRKQLGWHRTNKKHVLCAWCVGGEHKCQHTLVGLHT